MIKPRAADTSAVWEAVGRQPSDKAMQQMTEDGWEPVETDREATRLVFRRDGKKATLFLKKNQVGMVVLEAPEA
ncbi:MAG TPA: hypothetical protein VEK08_23680 [Planctomycetota bacterium]|nr:hypothetical protein [Planctomycetota bacterium]